jgi:drug/metabolite transporter (DMT)-like permease
VGIIISLAGVLIVVNANSNPGNSSFRGVLLIFLAVFSAVGYSLLVKKLTERFNPFTIVAWQNGMGAVLFLPLFLLFEFPQLQFSSITWKALLPVIYLTFFASVLAFIFFVNAVAAIGASKANIFTNAIPVFTALFSWLLLGEQLGAIKLAGMLIVMAGIIMSQMSRTKISRLFLGFRSQE